MALGQILIERGCKMNLGKEIKRHVDVPASQPAVNPVSVPEQVPERV